MSRPLFAEPAERRRELALELHGELVAVHVDTLRDGDTVVVRGRLIAVPDVIGAAPAHVVIRRSTDPADDLAVSLAQVRRIADLCSSAAVGSPITSP